MDKLNKKDHKKTEVILDDGDDFLKGLKTYGEDDWNEYIPKKRNRDTEKNNYHTLPNFHYNFK